MSLDEVAILKRCIQRCASRDDGRTRRGADDAAMRAFERIDANYTLARMSVDAAIRVGQHIERVARGVAP